MNLRPLILKTVATAAARKRYEYMGSVHPVGAEIETAATDGWEFNGGCVKQTDDGEGRYLLVRWRREVRP